MPDIEQEDRLELFEIRVRGFLKEFGDFLIEKNRLYGDSAMRPVRIFSRSTPDEQIRVRIDDKLSRLAKGQGEETEDIVLDLLGYLVILRFHMEDSKAAKEVLESIHDRSWLSDVDVKSSTALTEVMSPPLSEVISSDRE